MIRSFRVVAPVIVGLALLSFYVASSLRSPDQSTGYYGWPSRREGPLSCAEQLRRFHLPAGFRIELIASEPQIQKPISLAFDAHGRLLVTTTVQYPLPSVSSDSAADKVVALSDEDGDGSFETVSTAIDFLSIPTTVVPSADALIYYSVPSIWTAHTREGSHILGPPQRLFGPFGYEDTHGMPSSFHLWLDGWVYACHGFGNTSEVAGSDHQRVVMSSGQIFRFRPDGSHVELYAHGLQNPFGLTHDSYGNLFATDSGRLPVHAILQGGCYPGFRAIEDGLGFVPPIMDHDHGSSGMAGVAFYDAAMFPVSYHGALFLGNPVTGRVNCDKLERVGSTYRAIKQADFLTCGDPWFRPVDIKLGPDGALYIADFYNSVIQHTEVALDSPDRDHHHGRVWRISYVQGARDAPPAPWHPDLTKMDTAQLLELLAHDNLTVRLLATEVLVSRRAGEHAQAVLKSKEPGMLGGRRRAHALWVVERATEHGLDDEVVKDLLQDPEAVVRVHAMKALSERDARVRSGGSDLAASVRRMLSDPEPFARRAAASALGHRPHIDNLLPLLKLLCATDRRDGHLRHVVRLALREHLIIPEIQSKADQLVRSAPWLADALVEAQVGVNSPEAAMFLIRLGIWQSLEHNKVRHGGYVIGRHVGQADLLEAENLLHAYRQASSLDRHELLAGLCDGFQARGVEPPLFVLAESASTARELISAGVQETDLAAIELIRRAKLHGFGRSLCSLGLARHKSANLRALALTAYAERDAPNACNTLKDVASDASELFSLRCHAVRLLASGVDLNQSAALRELLGVEDLRVVVAAELANRHDSARVLLQQLTSSGAGPERPSTESIRKSLETITVPDAEEVVVAATGISSDTDSAPPSNNDLFHKYRDVSGSRGADPSAGGRLFNEFCVKCHTFNGRGGVFGPTLDGAGTRTRERLIEDIFLPSRRVEPGYYSTVVLTKSGQLLTGVRLPNRGDLFPLVDLNGDVRHVTAEEIDGISTTTTSPMPDNFSSLIAPGAFADLVSFFEEGVASPPEHKGTAVPAASSPLELGVITGAPLVPHDD